MSGPMVRALVDGRKTVTRRVIKPQPAEYTPRVIDIDSPVFNDEAGEWGQWETIWDWTENISYEPLDEVWRPLRPPFRAGDLVYVREAWRVIGWRPADTWLQVQYLADHATGQGETPDTYDGDGLHERLWMQACDDLEAAGYRDHGYGDDGDDGSKWRHATTSNELNAAMRTRSPLHLPEFLSRLKLRITSITAERLQDITESDAAAEGVERLVLQEGPDFGDVNGVPQRGHPLTSSYRDAYRALWDSLNADRGHPWDSNPWVWRIEFEVLEGEVPA